MARVLQLERPPSLTSMVIDTLRRGIVDNRFALGSQLSEVTIAAELGVSRTPVREAFLALKEQGLVEIRPQRGTFVFTLSRAEFRALAELRGVLELGALRLAAARDAGALVAALAPNVERMRALPARALAEGLGLDTAWHAALIEASGNPWLVDVYARIAGRIEAIRQRWQMRHGDLQRIAGNHAAIVAAIARGDLSTAAAELDGHITRSAKHYEVLLDEQPGGDPA
jgi:DNA-binding GntR family transcriptional regulator